MLPVTGESEAAVDVAIRVPGLREAAYAAMPPPPPRTHPPDPPIRCGFGAAGTSAARFVTLPSTDPLRPERTTTELRCSAPPCMRFECIGTVEITIALNGFDHTGFTPPLLFQFRNEFGLHVWGCDASNASRAIGAPAHVCGEAVVQRAATLGSEQHELAEIRSRRAAQLSTEAAPSAAMTAEILARREADRAITSWELAQARRDDAIAAASARAAAERLADADAALAAWDAVATVARLPLAGRAHVAIDPLDKRLYWVGADGALRRAHFGPAAQLGATQALGHAGTDAAGLHLHRPSARLYWTAREDDGSTAVWRAYLDGGRRERLLSGMPAQTRVLASTASADGTLLAVFIAVAQPANASLLVHLEEKASARDATPASTSIVTLLRDVAPTAVAVHGDHFYLTVASAQAVRRCSLDSLSCVTLHTATLPWGVPSSRPSAPAGLALDPTAGAGLAWADAGARRLFHSTPNGSATRALWWTAYEPLGVTLGFDGPPAALRPVASPTVAAITPLGGPR